ncbi:MAG: AmmeMemoRadiSam system radical SAM enzyme [Candidatus Anstonellaceae archaeon]
MKEAQLYRKMPQKAVLCFLCQRRCYIKEGQLGFCLVRKNTGGKLYSLNWGKCVSYAVDPIEKKPFYHFVPGSPVFSFAAAGCNFRCQHCQNWEISHVDEAFGQQLEPQRLVHLAKSSSAEGIAYTYTEPTIFFEYARDTALIAKKHGLYNVFVTNGYMTPEAIEKMEWLDAARIDLKAFSDKFYKEICGGAYLEPVLKSIKLLHRKMHIEIINLLIPTLNDSEDEIRALSKWVKELDPAIPLHFTGYYPANRMTLPPTSVQTLSKARKIALEEGLLYVYTGNRPGEPGENTYCPSCGQLVIRREGMMLIEDKVKKRGECPFCGFEIPIVYDWKRYSKLKRSD